MNAYEFDISRATDSGTLHAYAEDIESDLTLHEEEKKELLQLIGQRFAQLNQAAAGKPKPRWD